MLPAFQVVVDDDRVGLDLVRLLNKAGRGRVTFMPLNKLRVKDAGYPTQFGDKAVPLYKLIKCPDKYKKAVQQVKDDAVTFSCSPLLFNATACSSDVYFYHQAQAMHGT